MINFLESLTGAGFEDIIIVNDGSSAAALKYFERASEHPQVTILTHETNRGKGAALKTAFAYLAENRKDIECAVTVDSDGQHDLSCINACMDAAGQDPDSVIFGGRDFGSANVPLRSLMGNRISTVVYRFAIGAKLKDTQTGLRLVPGRYFEEFSNLKGDRYEYETSMIMYIVNKNIPYIETPIETIYIDNNSSSHFDTVKDSVRIYRLILVYFFRFILSSISSWVVDIGIYYLTGLALDVWFPALSAGSFTAFLFQVSWRVCICTLTSRIISSIFNYILNRKTVFKSEDKAGRTARRYYTLALCQLIASMLLVDLFAVKILNVTGFLQTLVKCVVDLLLFLLSYTIQRKWVFKNKKDTFSQQG